MYFYVCPYKAFRGWKLEGKRGMEPGWPVFMRGLDNGQGPVTEKTKWDIGPVGSIPVKGRNFRGVATLLARKGIPA